MLTLDLRIVLVSPLHIGAGSDPSNAAGAQRFARDARGRPCLRASTLKGLHRASTEQIARALGLPVCHSPIAAQMCQPCAGEPVCAVCRIFGSPWVPGRVFYRDLIAASASDKPGVDRRVRAAQSRGRRVRLAVYEQSREVLLVGVTFSGTINHLLHDEGSLGLALAGLRAIPAIGAGSAAGYGLCHVEVHALDASNRPVDESALAAALERLRAGRP